MAVGQFSGDSLTETGATVNSCLNVMIVRSDNPCGHALLDKVGPSTSEIMTHQRGFTSTYLASKSSFITTAQDTTNYLRELQMGTLLRSDYRQELINYMSRQIYRQGIPAANPGVTVADKVGFIEIYNHDAAIVYGPKSTYVITVLSANANFSRLANLAGQVALLMNR